MAAKKINIKNRKNQKIVVLLDISKKQKGLVFIMHGLSGCKEEAHIAMLAQTFSEAGFIVVRFDTTNTFGESDGSYENATVTNYYEDLEDVINWSKTQDWYEEPFCLVGHSLGGICTALYAEKYPEKVKALAPISTTISYELSLKTTRYENHKEMKARGWVREKNGLRLKWAHMEDRKKYNLLDNAAKLKMPVLMIVGEKDESALPQHQKILYEKLPGKKEFHIIKNALHSFKEKEHLDEIKQIFKEWIRKVVL